MNATIIPFLKTTPPFAEPVQYYLVTVFEKDKIKEQFRTWIAPEKVRDGLAGAGYRRGDVWIQEIK